MSKPNPLGRVNPVRTEGQAKAMRSERRREWASTNATGPHRTGPGADKQTYGMGDDWARAREQIAVRVQRVTAWHAAGCPEPKPNWNEE